MPMDTHTAKSKQHKCLVSLLFSLFHVVHTNEAIYSAFSYATFESWNVLRIRAMYVLFYWNRPPKFGAVDGKIAKKKQKCVHIVCFTLLQCICFYWFHFHFLFSVFAFFSIVWHSALADPVCLLKLSLNCNTLAHFFNMALDICTLHSDLRTFYVRSVQLVFMQSEQIQFRTRNRQICWK